MFSKKTIRDFDFGTGKRVLVTVDFNVPVNDDGTVIDDYRIRQTLPTLKYLLDKGCSLVLIGHLGRPTSKDDPKTSFKHVAARLSQLLGLPVAFATDCIGEEAKKVAAYLDLPLYTFDYREEYEKRIVEYIYREYEAGRTPNPDVFCNNLVKFDLFLDGTAEYTGMSELPAMDRGAYGLVVKAGGEAKLVRLPEPGAEATARTRRATSTSPTRCCSSSARPTRTSRTRCCACA